MNKRLFFVALFLLPVAGFSQQLVKLYPGAIPNSKDGQLPPLPAKPNPGLVYQVMQPELELYIPDKSIATGAAVVICPGGSYKVLSYQGEGIRTAKEMQKRGIAAFVLKYRLPDDAIMQDKSIGPLQDAQQAIKYVRENASQWQIDTARVGIVGFSAGGHLASTVATHFKKAYVDNPQHTNLRPAFVVLVYPVISMQDALTHKDSRTNLLGKDPTKEQKDLFSNELQVTANTPPTFITHASDDRLVDVDNSIAFYEALRRAGVSVEMHLLPKGGHGFFGVPIDQWITPIFNWMKNQKIIKDPVH